MTFLRKIWTWLKRYWGIIVGALGVGIGALVAGTIYRRQNGSLRAALEAERAKGKIRELRGRRELLLEQYERDEQEITAIDVDLEENRRAIEAVRKSAGVPDDQLAEEFRRLGF